MIFYWYTNNLLLRTIGTAQWGDNVRFYTTISNATTKLSGEELKLVTPSTEAFVVLNYHNCYQKWLDWFEWESENGFSAKERKANGKPNKPPTDKDSKKYKALFSMSEGGQKEIDGWTIEGKKQFVAYRKEIKAVVTSEDEDVQDMVKKVEQEVLASMRKVKGIEEEDHDAHRRAKKRKSRDVPDKPPSPKKICTYESDEE